MTERAKEFYERDSVPTVTTAHTTPTTRSLTVAPMVLRNTGLFRSGLLKYATGYDLNRSHFEIGSGSMTAHSRAEVARITWRLKGRMKP